MLNKAEASRLLSESCDRELTNEEQSRLDAYLSSDTEMVAFRDFLGRLRDTAHKFSRVDASEHSSRKEKLPDKHKLFLAQMIADASQVAVPARQVRDAVFASVLLQQGKFTDSQLLNAIDDWSAFGNESLGDYLLTRQLIDDQELSRYQSIADDTISSQAANDTVNEISIDLLSSHQELSKAADLLGLTPGKLRKIENSEFRIGGEYSVIGRLGGGLGSVWLARDKSLDRTVAIKTIAKRSDVSESMIARFEREAKITGRLDHPNIVTVYQFGEDEESGNLFYAMKFVGKRTLLDEIREYHHRYADGLAAKGDFQKLLSAFMTVCQAIGFAHSKGVIHRDLKPQNVAVDDFGQITVIDWGLAKLTNDFEISDGAGIDPDQKSPTSDKTMVGQVLGTPMYMSPEQAAGRVDTIDERTDVYGLGAILFEILTGIPPHAGERASSGSSEIEELLTSIVQQSTPRVRDVFPDADPDLSSICERALAKRKYSRYSCALEISDAIQEWLGSAAQLAQRRESLKSHVREFENKLSGLCEDMSRNLRFLSILPPIQGVIDSTNQRSGCESTGVWIGRLHQILEGLLRTNPEIVAISFFGLDETATQAREISCVQRHRKDASFINPVPASRLVTMDLADAFPDLMDAEPGDSRFSLVDQLRPKKTKTSVGCLRAALPVFDGGEIFGFVTIHVRLEMPLAEASRCLQHTAGIQVYVLDNQGKVLFSEGGQEDVSGDDWLDRDGPALNEFLSGVEDQILHNNRLLARKFCFDDQDESSTGVCIVAVVSGSARQ